MQDSIRLIDHASNIKTSKLSLKTSGLGILPTSQYYFSKLHVVLNINMYSKSNNRYLFYSKQQWLGLRGAIKIIPTNERNLSGMVKFRDTIQTSQITGCAKEYSTFYPQVVENSIVNSKGFGYKRNPLVCQVYCVLQFQTVFCIVTIAQHDELNRLIVQVRTKEVLGRQPSQRESCQ